jgi:phage repressor protein C with HTH and peptisase S24 domain
MSNLWRKRLRSVIEHRSLNMKQLSLAAGLGETAVRDALERGQTPKIDNFAALAKALGLSLSELYEGEAAVAQAIQIIGAVSAGESWLPIDDGLGEIEMRVDGDPVALEVRGDSMVPVYRPGDVLVGAKRHDTGIKQLVGQDCIVLTSTGERYVKYLQKSPARGHFTLRSYNPAHADIETVKLSWAAPILWIKRAGKKTA